MSLLETWMAETETRIWADLAKRYDICHGVSDYLFACLFPGMTRTLLIFSSGEIVSQFTT